MNRRRAILTFLLIRVATSIPAAAATSESSEQLRRAFRQFPTADLNGDGILTDVELRTFHRERAQRMKGRGRPPVFDTLFTPAVGDLEAAIEAGRRRHGSALKFPPGNGLRVLLAGHSWVAPAERTLPAIAAAAGFDGHRQRAHLSAGATGSANAIWLKEFGRFKQDPPRPNLVPALATGAWDVLICSSYYQDQPAYFTQWIQLGLRFNPEMKFFIQDGWPRVTSDYLKLQPAAAAAKLNGEMQRMVNDYFAPGFTALNQRQPGRVHFIPAGPAIVELTRRYLAGEIPGFDCLSEHFGGERGIFRDGSHLSKHSGAERLLGYVYFSVLYRRSPTHISGNLSEDVSDATDRQLRQIAWQVVVASPLSGVKDADGDGVAD